MKEVYPAWFQDSVCFLYLSLIRSASQRLRPTCPALSCPAHRELSRKQPTEIYFLASRNYFLATRCGSGEKPGHALSVLLLGGRSQG